MKKYIECKQCKFYKQCSNWSYLPNQNSGTDTHNFCMYPENIVSSRNPKKPIFKSSPSVINKDHDCNWFQPKDPSRTYVWDSSERKNYKDHGIGTFNINPEDGIDGFYIGEKTFKQYIEDYIKSIIYTDENGAHINFGNGYKLHITPSAQIVPEVNQTN